MTDSSDQQGPTMHRIDGAHEQSSEGTVSRPEPGWVASAAGAAREHAEEQTHLQGHQLVTALSARRREIDRREAQFNAYLATLENQSRTIRLTQNQRDTELAKREEDYASRIAELARREAALQGRDDPPQGSQEFQALRAMQCELDERHQALTTAQAEVDSAKRLLTAQRDGLQQRAAQWEQSRQRDETRLAQMRKAQQSQHEDRSQSLQQRSAELDKRQAALEQMQANVTHAHREALELRLATEQLWSQLADKVSPNELAESLGLLRSKIGEHYRSAEESLARQRNDFQAMAQRLDQQRQNLHSQREELQQWASRRGEEIEFQAARLVARQQEMEAQQHQHVQSREAWEAQRHEYEDEIRRLRAEIRQGQAALV